jgi:hypothetical protein
MNVTILVIPMFDIFPLPQSHLQTPAPTPAPSPCPAPPPPPPPASPPNVARFGKGGVLDDFRCHPGVGPGRRHVGRLVQLTGEAEVCGWSPRSGGRWMQGVEKGFIPEGWPVLCGHPQGYLNFW